MGDHDTWGISMALRCLGSLPTLPESFHFLFTQNLRCLNPNVGPRRHTKSLFGELNSFVVILPLLVSTKNLETLLFYTWTHIPYIIKLWITYYSRTRSEKEEGGVYILEGVSRTSTRMSPTPDSFPSTTPRKPCQRNFG